jgi:hypothetical protein
MTDEPTNGPALPPDTQETISRRRLLKALTGTGGAIAAWSLLPGKWTRPVVEASVLPQSAAASGTQQLTLSRLAVQPRFDKSTQPEAAFFTANFDYRDPMGQVSDSATLRATVDPCGGQLFFDTLGKLAGSSGLVRTGNGSSGHISFPFNADFGCVDNGADLCMQLGAGGRLSNTLCGTIPKQS